MILCNSSLFVFDDCFCDKTLIIIDCQYGFSGGVADMAAWSVLLWHSTIDMLEEGTDTCTIPTNPLFINCSKSSRDNPMLPRTTQKKRLKNPGTVMLQQDLHKKVNLSDLNVRRTKRGSYMSFSKSLVSKIYEKVDGGRKKCLGCQKEDPQVTVNENRAAHEVSTVSAEYSSSVPYARVGW